MSGLPAEMAPPCSVIPNINWRSRRLYKRLIFFLSAPPNNPPTMPFCTELFNFLLISHPVSKSRAISHRLQASCRARDASPAGFDIFMADCLIYPMKIKTKKRNLGSPIRTLKQSLDLLVVEPHKSLGCIHLVHIFDRKN